jgi:hypothetical protein
MVVQNNSNAKLLASIDGVSTPNIVSRNNVGIVAHEGGSVRVANTIFRENPALVALESMNVKLDSLVADVPYRWLGASGDNGISGGSGDPGVSGGTPGSFITQDFGVYGTNFSVYLGNSTATIKEPSDASSYLYGLGSSELRDLKMLSSDIRIETANTANLASTATQILNKTTNVVTDGGSAFIRSTKNSAYGANITAPTDEV